MGIIGGNLRNLRNQALLLAPQKPKVKKTLENAIISHGDCRSLLKNIENDSIDFIVTDPPYFIDGMGSEWNDASLRHRASNCGVVGGLPIGMKFDRKQGEALQSFMTPIAKEFYRILKPGAFCIVFSQARLYHRMAMSVDMAGFEIRDMLAWKYEGQAKAFSQSHFIRKNNSLSEIEKETLINELDGYKTPQLKPQIEPMVLAQKPKIGTFVDNWRKYGVGLVNMNESLDGKCPGNVMEVSKHERRNTEGGRPDHLTVKPVEFIAHLIRLFTREGQIVLDPFMGSGSHGVAAIKNHRKFIGFEIEKRYFEISKERIGIMSND